MDLDFAIVALGFAGLLAVLSATMGPRFLRHRREQRLRREGVLADARIIDLHDTGNRFNDMPELAISLLVMAPGAEPFPSELRRFVSLAELGNFARGSMIPVRFDPRRPGMVALASNGGRS